MPYIERQRRSVFDESIFALVLRIKNAHTELYPERHLDVAADGEVNYILSKIITELYNNRKYSDYNRAMGILESVKQEFYRSCVAPYEEQKKQQNGEL